MKKKFSKEVKIGIAFVISIFVLYFGISFLKGVNIFKPTNSYTVVFSDVTGLALSSPVMMNGYQVGLVYSIELDENDPSRVVTVLNMDKGVRIPRKTEVSLDAPMLGNAMIILKPDFSDTQFYTSSDTIVGHRVSGMMDMASGLMPQLEGMLPKVDSILSGLQLVVNHPALPQSLNNVEQITNDLRVSTQQLNSLMASLNKDVPTITKNFATISNDMTGVSSKLKSLDIEKTYNSVDETLKNIQLLSDKLNGTDNSLGLLVNDRQLYDSITSTLNNASLLLKDVKENPGRYINVKVF